MILLFVLFLVGCSPVAKPESNVYNITDNSQVIIANDSQVISKPENITKPDVSVPITTEQTKKDSMWIFWAIVFSIGSIGLYFLWRKYGKKIS